MRNDILDYLQNELYVRCQKPENKFGMGCYYHIEAVVKNGGMLAEKYGAEKEIVMIAAWLHDIASVTDYALYEDHHIHGAEIARSLLGQLSYDEQKIRRVQECIRKHRGSVHEHIETVEELCVADADAISHFDRVEDILYLAYVEKHMNVQDGVRFVKGKLDRSFAKLSEESKKYYQEKYHQVMSVLE